MVIEGDYQKSTVAEMQRIRRCRMFCPKWNTYISSQGSRTNAGEVVDDKETVLNTVVQLQI